MAKTGKYKSDTTLTLLCTGNHHAIHISYKTLKVNNETEIAVQLTSSKRGKSSASCDGAQAYLPSSAFLELHRSVSDQNGT